MKDLTEYYRNKDVIFKDIKQIKPKELGSRKKIEIYVSTSLDSQYYAIFVLNAKSRFLRKNADDLILMCEALSTLVGHNFKKKELLICCALCSKAKAYLKENSWSVRVDYK